LITARFAGRNGAGVSVGGGRRVGEGKGVSVRAGRGVKDARTGLGLGIEVGVALGKLGGVWAGSLALLQARQRRMATKRTELSRM